MSEKTTSAQDIVGSIDNVLEHLELNGRSRQALEYANLLLTHLMTLLRPIRIKKQQPGGPRTYTIAERSGLPFKKVRLLKDSVFRGVREIEDGEYLLAKTTFVRARKEWQADGPKPTD
jgi:hypothetical protein